MTDSIQNLTQSDGFQRLSQPSFGREIASRVRRDIVLGRVPAGTVLIQDQLCQVYGVSRMPARDALMMLDNQGFVRQVGRQMVVAAFEERDLIDTFHVEAVLCGLTARRAAELATEEDIERLRNILHPEVDPPGGVADIAWEFHRQVNLMSSSARLLAALRTVSVTFVQDFTESLPDWWHTSSDEHDDILDALATHDGDRADRLMFEHFKHAGDRLAELIREHSPS